MPRPRNRPRPIPISAAPAGDVGPGLLDDARRAIAEQGGYDSRDLPAWYVERHGSSPQALEAVWQARREDAATRGVSLCRRRIVPDDA